MEMRKSSGLLQKFFPKTSASTSGLSSPSNEDTKLTAAELAMTYHTVKHNLSYSSQDCGIKLNKIIFVDSKTATNLRLARTKMEALVTEVLGPHSLQSVIDQLNKDNVFYCLQTDASNKKNIKLFPLVVQYFTPKNGIQQKLIDFYENPDESANGMFSAIKNSLEFYQLPFNQLSGFSADNTNANFGHNHSLYTNILEVVPDLIKGNCHAHIVHNSVKNSMNCLNYDIENIILKIYSHFSVSACRREELKRFVAVAEGEFHEIKRHIGTRWLSLLPAIDTILLNWTPICNYFVSLDVDCPMVIQNLLMLDDNGKNNVIYSYLLYASHILNVFNKTIKKLEGNNVTILDVYNIMTGLKTELIQRKNDKYFGHETKKVLNIIRESSQEVFDRTINNFILFIEKANLYLEKWFDFSQTNWLSLISCLSLKSAVTFDHFEKIIENLNLYRLNIGMDDLYSEITNFKVIYEKVSEDKDFLEMSTSQKWSHLLVNTSEEFKNIIKIVSYLLSVPATSAFTERVFSVMNAKWRDDRNKASINLIKNELLIYFNFNFDCNEAYDVFKNDCKLVSCARSSKKYVFKNNK